MVYHSRKVPGKDQYLEQLAKERSRFRASLPPDIAEVWKRGGRIAVVLSGGGARGAYEAGVLLAFQDAQLPTHILASTSIGSINAASYAAHSDSLVGCAEPLVESWSEVTPSAVGIDWFRYVLVLFGLVLASAGFGNFAREFIHARGMYVHLEWPKLTWFVSGLLGASIVLFHDDLSYLGFILKSVFHRRRWRPDRAKATRSVIANVVLWGCAAVFFTYAHIHLSSSEVMRWSSRRTLLFGATSLVAIAALLYALRATINFLSHQFLRLPLRSGLFPNFERTRFLRGRIPDASLRRSPIRVVMTAADVNSGMERVFSNASKEELIRDTGVDARFVLEEVAPAADLLMTVVASSAFPMVYETVPMLDSRWTDGGIVANQPIRPAIRLGADTLLLVLVEPRTQQRQEIHTFLDVGVRAIDVLMAQNLKTDLKILSGVNALCTFHATEVGLRPEQVELDVGTRRYRYLQSFTIAPERSLEATVLDFNGEITVPALLQGYRDALRELRDFEKYLRGLPADAPRVLVKLRAGQAKMAQWTT